MNNPLRFSIVTVTYNAEKVLERTLQSVASQTYPHIEYIIVDGASKDGTQALAERYRAHISTFVSEPDKGLYDAMNKALPLCTGDYICFLNAGDCLYSPDTLRLMAEGLKGSQLPDVLYGDTAIVDDKGRFLHLRAHRPPRRLTWRSFRQGMLVCHQAFWVRRDLAEKYDLQYRFSADFDWCIRILKRCKCTHDTRQILVDYLEEGMTTQNHKASLRERFRIMCRHYGVMTTLGMHAWFAVRAVCRKCFPPQS